MAQQSPVKRASAMRPSARRHSMRTRSPQSGLTSSNDASALGTLAAEARLGGSARG